MKEEKDNNIGFDTISANEKEVLKQQIFDSVEKHKRKRHRIRYAAVGMAASVIFVCGLALYVNQDRPTSISDFVKSSGKVDVNESDEVVLILNDSANVKVGKDSSMIKYSATGENVNIGSRGAVRQKTSNKEETIYNTILVPYGRRSEIVLSDGTHVWLNSGSRLVYPALFKGSKREVYLEGEAIFDVSHDKEHPFLVLSESQEITVLGTVFNVSNYLDDSSAQTVLKSGRVQIAYRDDAMFETKKKLNISPGTMASYNKIEKKIASKKVNVDHYFSWREGVLIFKNDDLRTIMRRLSRYYNIHIEIENDGLGGETFSGYLDLREDVEKVIATIQQTTDFEYVRQEKAKINITNSLKTD